MLVGLILQFLGNSFGLWFSDLELSQFPPLRLLLL